MRIKTAMERLPRPTLKPFIQNASLLARVKKMGAGKKGRTLQRLELWP